MNPKTRTNRKTDGMRTTGLVLLVALVFPASRALADDFSGHWFGGGGPGEGVSLAGVWNFDQYSPAQMDSVETCANGSIGMFGEIMDPQGWVPSPGSTVIPRIERMEPGWIDEARFPGGLDTANVGGGVVAYYAILDDGHPGFLPFQVSLMESPIINLAELGIPAEPLVLHFSSLCNSDPELATLQWVVGVRYSDGNVWTPWFDQVAPVAIGAAENTFDLAPSELWMLQIRIGVRNPGETLIRDKKGPAADKGKVEAKPPVVLDETWKYVPDIKQDGPTCAAASIADCLAYWSKNGYPEIMPAGRDTTAKHNKLRDDLVKSIYGKDGKIGGTGDDADNWLTGIDKYLESKGVTKNPQPNGRRPLVHKRQENPSCDYMREHFGQCHDVMIYFKWCDADGNIIKKDDAEPAHQITLAGLVKTSDGKTVAHAAHGWGKQTDEVTKDNRGSAYDQFEVECVDGRIQLKNKALQDKHGGDHLCVTEINVVEPEPQSIPAPRLVLDIARQDGERSMTRYGYGIYNDETEPIDYFAMILAVPYSDVTAPSGWTWQPLPAPYPNATDCDQWIRPTGILWRTTSHAVLPGQTVSGFTFATDDQYPTEELVQWYTQTTPGSGLFGMINGPVPALSAGVAEPAEPASSSVSPDGILSFPNPARANVTLRFALSAPSEYRLDMFDAGGRKIRAFNSRGIQEGVQSLVWDRRDERGERVPSGVYFYRLVAGGRSAERRLVLLP